MRTYMGSQLAMPRSVVLVLAVITTSRAADLAYLSEQAVAAWIAESGFPQYAAVLISRLCYDTCSFLLHADSHSCSSCTTLMAPSCLSWKKQR